MKKSELKAIIKEVITEAKNTEAFSLVYKANGSIGNAKNLYKRDNYEDKTTLAEFEEVMISEAERPKDIPQHLYRMLENELSHGINFGFEKFWTNVDEQLDLYGSEEIFDVFSKILLDEKKKFMNSLVSRMKRAI